MLNIISFAKEGNSWTFIHFNQKYYQDFKYPEKAVMNL